MNGDKYYDYEYPTPNLFLIYSMGVKRLSIDDSIENRLFGKALRQMKNDKNRKHLKEA